MLPYEAIYPGMKDRPPFGDLCTRLESTYNGQPFEFKHGDCYLLSGCEEMYPEAVGLDHNCFGVSWSFWRD